MYLKTRDKFRHFIWHSSDAVALQFRTEDYIVRVQFKYSCISGTGAQLHSCDSAMNVN